MYQQVKTEIGEDQPEGLVLHLVVKRETGLRHFIVWESRLEWGGFQQEWVAPAVTKVLAAVGGAKPPSRPSAQEMDLIDPTTKT